VNEALVLGTKSPQIGRLVGNLHKIPRGIRPRSQKSTTRINTVEMNVFIQFAIVPHGGGSIRVSLREAVAEEEMPFIAEVIKGGRLTIPEEVRKLLRIEEGNYVLIRLKVVSRKRLGKKHRKNSQNGNGGT